MRKTLVLVLLGAFVLAGTAMPATAAKKKKVVTEEWQATAVPFPGAENHTDPATECGVQDVSYRIHSFTTPGRGTLEARISGFEGEWDLYVTDGEGTLLGSSVNFMAGPEEKVTLPLPAKKDIQIYACNFAGGPTAQGDLRYTYVAG